MYFTSLFFTESSHEHNKHVTCYYMHSSIIINVHIVHVQGIHVYVHLCTCTCIVLKLFIIVKCTKYYNFIYYYYNNNNNYYYYYYYYYYYDNYDKMCDLHVLLHKPDLLSDPATKPGSSRKRPKGCYFFRTV